MWMSLWRSYYSLSNETFYFNVSNAPVDPLGVVTDATADGRAVLQHAHDAVMEVLAPFFKAANATSASVNPPTRLVVGEWSRPAAAAARNDTAG